jgi:protein-tyrosine kinase
MSKIYEALLRAEQDRIAADGKEPAPPLGPSTDVAPKAWPQPESPAIAEIASATADLLAMGDRRAGDRRIGPLDPNAPHPFLDAGNPYLDEPSTLDAGNPYIHQPDPLPDAPTPYFEASRALVDAPVHEQEFARANPNPLRVDYDVAPSLINVAPLDLNEVRAFPWKPSFEHLPALGERGSSVEQFRSLRSRMHEFRDLNTLKSLLVSSGLPQEGKSFIAANVAISFARHKASRVLLIDGDMRRSSLHHLLGCAAEPGLSDYLSGNATMLDIMQRAKPSEVGGFLHHGLASLTFIGAGKDSNTAADLSGNYRFDELIKKVSPYFDWIVVDSSPVNLVADGVNLSRACDGVLLVARAGVTKYEVAQRALTELKASNILGFVLNAVPDPPKTGGYYGYGGYDTYDAHEESHVSENNLEAAPTK